MIDLCSGKGGASAAMKDRGWEVLTVDIEPSFNPSVVADVRKWSWYGKQPDLIWASPPCTEFSRLDQPPWNSKKLVKPSPDMSIYDACRLIIVATQPRYYVIENVRGAIPYFGNPAARYKPFYLWGFFPDLGDIQFSHDKTNTKGSGKNRAAERARVPYELSLALALAVEHSQVLFQLPEFTFA